MFRTLLALGMLTLSVARADDLSLKKTLDISWSTAGWSVYTHAAKGRECLVAFNKNSLEVQYLSPKDGKLLGPATRLDVAAEKVSKVTTLSTQSGEFLIAFVNENARREQTIEVHTAYNRNSFSITPDAPVLALDLVERRDGQIFVVAQTTKGVERYERFKDKIRTAVLEEFEDDVNVGGNRVQGVAGATWALAPARDANQSALLVVNQPGQPTAKLQIGDARTVREVSTFNLKNQRFFAYVANDVDLALQTSGGVFPISNPRREFISSVRLVTSVRAFAIVLEGKKGSRLIMMEAK